MVKRLFLFALVGLVLVGFVFRRRGPSPENQPPELAAPKTDAAGVTHVGAVRLWQDYEANEVAADNRYKGKRLRVTGRVRSVEKNLADAAVLDLAGGHPIFWTNATLDSAQTQQAATLTKGSQVVVECTGAGRMMRVPQLEECSLLQP